MNTYSVYLCLSGSYGVTIVAHTAEEAIMEAQELFEEDTDIKTNKIHGCLHLEVDDISIEEEV